MYKCRKYKLQRIAVTIAAILWIVTAVRSFMERSIYAVNNTGSDIVSIFSENVDNNVQSDISVDTELSDNYLSEQAMCLILEKMASEIGINRIIYSILVITLMKMCIITVIFHGNVY